MIPVVTPAEMREVDAAAAESTDVLVARAGQAVAREVVSRVGGYGRTVVVVAGPGNNGADGRVAASLLRRRGARCLVFDATDLPARLPDADVVVDAAFGTGLRSAFVFPPCDAPLTVAVDIASGLDGDTGEVRGEPRPADVTVTFAAGKPGLYLGAGRGLSGEVVVVDIGLDVGHRDLAVVESADLAVWPLRAPDAHKWDHAVRIVAGSPGMRGAGALCSTAAMRAGASYVRWSPVGPVGSDPPPARPEVVTAPMDAADVGVGEDDRARFAAWALGPGLGRTPEVRDMVRRLAREVAAPMVLDADALWALGGEPVDPTAGGRVLTPHDGEYERLMGRRPGVDRVAAARDLATTHGGVALLKGPTTVVAAEDGRVRLVTEADQRLATAGTGDVLTGVIVAGLAAGLDAFDAAWAAAQWCAVAASGLPHVGAVAGDLADRLPASLDEATR